jgi:imidazolonepropionase-like amidohydrolase
VLVHPTDIEGVRAALAGRADILVHTTLGSPTPWPDALLREFIAADMAMMPTLKLLRYEIGKENVAVEEAEKIVKRTVEHFRAYVAAGGRVIFGTDVGYMTDYDPAEEYALMARAGMSPMQILSALTTEPAKAWREGDRRGRLVSGMDADLVVLDADPMAEPTNFAKVRCTFRQGKALYERTANTLR